MSNIINIICIILFVLFTVYLYNSMRVLFPLCLLQCIQCIWLLISSAYIEAGSYIIDIDRNSYYTGATIRLMLYQVLFWGVVLLLYKKYARFFNMENKSDINKSTAKKIQGILFIYNMVLFANVFISGSVLTNENISRFNFYTTYSILPIAKYLSYFILPVSTINGLVFVKYNKKKWSIINLLLDSLYMYLVGEQGWNYIRLFLYFCFPLLIMLVKKHFRFINFKRVVLFIIITLLAVTPKIKHFEEHGLYKFKSDSSIEMLMYRALILQGDVWWEIDRQVWESREPDFSQIKTEIQSFYNENQKENAGIYYLMKRAMPQDEYMRYTLAGGTLNNGYPVINIAIFGYLGTILTTILDGIIFFYLIKYIFKCILNNFYVRLFCITFIYLQYHKVISMGGINYMGNLFPIACILIIVFVEIFRAKFKIVKGENYARKSL